MITPSVTYTTLLEQFYAQGMIDSAGLAQFLTALQPLSDQEKIALLTEVVKVTEEKSFFQEASLQKFYQLAEQSQDLILLADKKGQLIYLNRTAKTQLNLPEHTHDDAFHVADFRAESKEEIREIIQVICNQKAIVQETQLKKYDRAEWIDIEANSFIVNDEQGNFVCIASICRDITERKKIEHELRDRNEELLAIEEELRQNAEELATTNEFLSQQQKKLKQFFDVVENSRDMIALVDTNTQFIFANKVFKEKIRLSKEADITNYNLIDFRAEEDIHKMKEMVLSKVIENGVSRHIAQFKCVGGQHFFEAETTAFPIYLPDSKELYCIGFISRDISEIKLAEQKLKLQQESFNSMTGVVPSMIFQYRQFTSGKGTFLYTSKGIEEVFEKRVGYFYDAQNFLSLILPEDQASFTTEIANCMANRDDFKWEGRFVLDSGEQKWGSAIARFEKVVKEDQSVIYSGVFTDITERKKDEELLLRQREELLLKNKEIAAQRDQIEIQKNKIDQQKSRQKKYNDVLLELTKSVEIQDGLWEQALEVICRKTAFTLGVTQVSVWIYNEEKGSLACDKMFDATHHGFIKAPTLTDNRYPIYFKRLTNGEKIVAPDIYNSEAYAEFSETRIASSLLRSIVEMPFFSGAVLGGVIKCGQLHHHIDWSLEDIAFINSISDLVKIAKEAHQRRLAEAEVKAQKRQLELKNTIIAKKNEDITSSLNYASRIQSAMLPSSTQMSKKLPDHFILYQPKEIVSGDFYWYEEKAGKIIIAAVDCTGHGVPGAFMSMLGNQLLDKIVNIDFVFEADQILNFLHLEVQKVLRQKDTGNNDGMDIALCVIDLKEQVLDFAGAHNPLVYIQHGELQVIKGDRLAVGGSDARHQTKPFTKHQIAIDTPTVFYLYSDGFQDQFGGAKNKKFGSKQFRQLLYDSQQLSMKLQKDLLETTLTNWMDEAGEDQVDDILVMGFQV